MSSHDVPQELLARQLREACSELERHLRAGSGRRVEDLLSAYPEVASDANAALELIYTEFVVREQLGQQPSPAEWFARFPQWREDLQQLFQVHRLACASRADNADTVCSSGTSDSSLADSGLEGTGGRPRFGPYELLGEIARGAMGVVYKARQLGLNRLVAVKMILAGPYATPEELRRFRTEAEAAACLQHPNIVQIYEVGERDGQPYFSLEYVEGGSLAHKLAGTPQPPGAAAALVATLARAVHYAHERGIIHRDLKPANVLLTGPTGAPLGECTPKITDFGLVKRLDVPSGHTQSGAIVGTPSYMAPEQAGGKGRAIGAAADVYALGGILYETLTGRPPFQGVTVLDTLEQVRLQEPMPPSRLQPKVPRDLETICLMCLHKEPVRRYASAATLADDLCRFLAGEPIQARPIRAWERGVKWARRRPLAAALVAVSALACASFVVQLIISNVLIGRERDRAEANYLQAERERQKAADNLKKARENLDKSLLVADQLLSRVSDFDLAHHPHMEQVRRALLEKALTFYVGFLKEHATDPDLRDGTARAYFRVANINQLLGRQKDAERAYRQALGLFQRLTDEFPDRPRHRELLAICSRDWSKVLKAANRFQEAEQALGHACRLGQQLVDQFPKELRYRSSLAASWSDLGLVLRAAGRFKEAEAALRQAVEQHEKLLAAAPSEADYQQALATSHNALAIFLADIGQFAQAEKSYRRAQQLLKKLVATHRDDPNYRQELAANYNNLGVLLSNAGRLQEAAQAQRHALALQEKLAADFPGVFDHRLQCTGSYLNLARLYWKTRQFAEMEKVCLQALPAAQHFAEVYPHLPVGRQCVGRLYNLLALALRRTGRTREAEHHYRQALVPLAGLVEDFPKVPEYRTELAGTLCNLAPTLRALGDLAEARRVLEKAITHQRAALQAEPRHQSYREFLRNQYLQLTETLISLGDHQEAVCTAVQLPQLYPGSWQAYHAAACFLARCVPLAEKDTHIAPAKRQQLVQAYGEKAVCFLGEAVQKYGKGGAGLLNDPTLKPLHGRAAFKKLVEK
jgi:tetratricopeptide (TPR) repeat protein/tRNA A-37 threonylcarbamoyl transferase component Bud32